MKRMKNSYWLVLSAVLVVFDQWSKITMETWLMQLPTRKQVVIPDYLSWELAYNKGASFGIQFPGSYYVFIALGLLIPLGIIIWLFINQRKQRFFGLGLSLVLAGALGNVWDRIQLEHVIDFINASNPLFSWPIFNVADIAICIGVAVIVIDMLFVSGRQAKEPT